MLHAIFLAVNNFSCQLSMLCLSGLFRRPCSSPFLRPNSCPCPPVCRIIAHWSVCFTSSWKLDLSSHRLVLCTLWIMNSLNSIQWHADADADVCGRPVAGGGITGYMVGDRRKWVGGRLCGQNRTGIQLIMTDAVGLQAVCKFYLNRVQIDGRRVC